MTNFHLARRILLCLRYGIGDVVMETPVLEALRNAARDAVIVGIGARPALEILEDDSRVDELICVQDWGLNHWGDEGTPDTVVKINKWLSEQNHDLILDPSHAVIALREAIWKHRSTIYDSGQRQMPALLRGSTGVEAIKTAVRDGWGLEVPIELSPSLRLSPEILRLAKAYVRNLGGEGSPLVAVSPVSSSPLKCWPVERFAAVADWLIRDWKSRILFISGPQDGRTARIISRLHYHDRVALVGPTHLRRVAGLLSFCDLLICNDTGLMHMAAAVGTPVVAVFGPTSPSLYLPPSELSRSAGGESPCPHRKEVDFGPSPCIIANRCLKSGRSCICEVETREVIRLVEGQLERIT